MQPIEILRVGSFTSSGGADVRLTVEDLDMIARTYDPDVFEAPIVVGHPKDDLPAYGWIERLARIGDKLLAYPRQVEDAFKTLVQDGRFKKISASLYSPDHQGNPSKGGYYLKYVGFLGAAAPAVRGLKPVAFTGDEGDCLSFAQDMPATPPTDDQLAKAWHDIATQKAALRQAGHAAFIEDLARQGKPVIGTRKALVLSLMESLDDTQGDLISFEEFNGQAQYSQLAVFKTFLNSLPHVVKFGEVDKSDAIPEGASVSLKDYDGPVDMDRLTLHRSALTLSKQEGIPYAQAIHVLTQNK